MVTLSLTFEQLVNAAKQLSSDEKVHLAEILWDDTEVNIPKDIQNEVLRRLDYMEKYPDTCISSNEFHKRIKSKYGL